MGNEIKLSGFKEFGDKLKKLPADIQQEARGIVKDEALHWQELIDRAVPVAFGHLKGNITAEETGELEWSVTSPQNYSAYVEWGTKKKVSVPADMQNYASQFKGGGTGTYKDFIQAIYEWVGKKGIGVTYKVSTKRKNRQTKDEKLSIAQAIAFSIMKNGIAPHPYFFIHKSVIQKSLDTRLKTLINTQR